MRSVVTADDLEDARRRVSGVIRATPVEPSDTLSRLAGRQVLLKPEHRQRTGAGRDLGIGSQHRQIGFSVIELR